MAGNADYLAIFSSRALKEITASWEWYEERQQGLGDRFVASVTRRTQLIEQNPERYPIRFRSYRETLVPIFPFVIIYRVNKKKKTVRIVSVFHTSLNLRRKY